MNTKLPAKLLENLRGVLGKGQKLVSVLRLANKIGVRYGLFSGGYVSLVTSNRPPTDFDFLTNVEGIGLLQKKFPQAVFVEQKGNATGKWLDPLGDGLIDFAAEVTIAINGHNYLVNMTDLAWQHADKVVIGDLTIYLANPVDTILSKAIGQRGPEQGKHDLEDIEALLKVVEIDRDYLKQRLPEFGADERATNCLRKFDLI